MIAIEFFRKDSSADAQLEGTVRTAARRLRTHLDAYYSDEGARDPILISLPKGSYVAAFGFNPNALPVGSSSVAAPASPKGPLWQIVVAWTMAATLAAAIYGAIGWSRVDAPPRPHAPLGRLLASSTSEGKHPIKIDLGHSVLRVMITPDGRKLYAIEQGNAVTVVDLVAMRAISTLHLSHPARTASFLSASGRYLYIGSLDNTVERIDTRTDTFLPELTLDGPVFDIAVSQDEKKLFVAMERAGLKRISLPSGESKVLSPFACPVFLTLDPAGRSLYVSYQCGGPGGRNGHDVVEIYDVKSEQRTGVIGDLPMVGSRIAFSPDGKRMLLAGADACSSPKYDHEGCAQLGGVPYYLERTEDHRLDATFFNHRSGATTIFSPDGDRLVSIDRTLVVFDWAKQRTLESIGLGKNYSELAFSPDSKYLIAGSYDPAEPLVIFETGQPGCDTRAGLANYYSADGTLDDSATVGALSAKSTPRFEPGLVGQALAFDQKSDPVLGAPMDACPFCKETWTESLFVKFGDQTREATVLERASPSPRWSHRIFRTGDDRIALEVGPSLAPIISRNPIGPPTWHHIAVVADHWVRRLYVDGILQGELDWAKLFIPDLDGDRGQVSLARSANSRNFLIGLLDEIAWFDRALTSDEVGEIAQTHRLGGCEVKGRR